MQIYEITGFQTGVSKEGVNFLQPSDSFQNIEDGFVNRQILQSRKGFTMFSTQNLIGDVGAGQALDGSRVMGIFENVVGYVSTELLAITKEYLYKYNEGTNTFLQISMSAAVLASLTNGTSFGIVSNESYVSGTTYPDKDGLNRFVFTGKGMQGIYFYDQAANQVKLFTDTAVDNMDFEQPAAAIGNITNAHFAIWFGERLNLINPTTGTRSNPQAVLYSAIRTVAGNGDKFNTKGSGLLPADTSEYINGASINGDVIILNFSRSFWILEKTRDHYNPYIIRKVPSELGSDASFSFINRQGENICIGKTGIVATDGKSSFKVDKKIPAYIEDEIDQAEIQLTYGGFERFNNQFMFSYKSIDNPNLTQDKVLINNYIENSWSVYNQRFSCFGQSDKGEQLTWDEIDENEDPSWLQWDTTEEVWNKIGVTAEVQKTLAGDDNGFIYNLNQDGDDYYKAITAITQASPCAITVGAHSFKVGDKVVVENVEGMTNLNNFDPEVPLELFIAYNVVAVGATTVSVNFDSTNQDAWTQNGTISKIIEFRAEMIPFNPFRDQGRKCYVSHIEFLLDTNNGFLTVDVFEDEEGIPFKSNVIIKPSQNYKKREWVSLSINQESNFLTVKMKQDSPSVQVVVTSIRIHCQPGGLSNG